MAFVYVLTSNASVVVGGATKAADYRILGANADALKERYVKNFHFNNTGVTDEDGWQKGDHTNPSWFYAKATHGATASYFCIYLDPRTSNDIRLHLATTTAAPTAGQGRLIIIGTDTAPANL